MTFARSRPLLRALVAAGSLGLAWPAFSGPPFLTDDPEPTETGHWEIYGPAADISGRGSAFDGSLGVELNYGATPNVQVTVGLPVSYVHDQAGWHIGRGDLEFSVKYRFFHDEDAGLSIAAFPGISAPTAGHNFGNRRVTALLPIWGQKDVGPWSMFGGGGYAVNPGAGNRDYWTGGVALTRQFSKRLLIGIEVDRQGPDTDGSLGSTSLGIGGILNLKAPFRILASAGPTFTGREKAGFHGFAAIGIDF